MKIRNLAALALALILLLTLTACGGNSAPKSESAYDAGMASPEAPKEMYGGITDSTTTSGASALPTDRKLIRTVRMEAETENLDSLLSALEEKLAALEGYVQAREIYNGSTYASRRYRNANMTVRIPADRVEEFTTEVGGMSNVVSTSLRREDVTLNYVATESKVTALKTEETRLLELLAQAETMSDLLEIEARLSDVRYELESYTTQLRTLDNQINYATVYLFIEEVQEYTPVEEPTLWERITGGFADSLEGLATGAVDLFV
jgi:hypothetical protein